VLSEVAEEEKIEVDESEIDAEIENMLQSAGENKEELRNVLNTPNSRTSIKQFLVSRKTVNRLVEIAKGSNINAEVNKEENKK
jgi:FKBP-type peptidyl-prolyl cis-trans isomerase (trigger factor)